MTYSASLTGSAAGAHSSTDRLNSTTDFLAVGGLTILMFVLLQCADGTGLSKEVSVAYHLRNFAALFPSLQLFVNYPHAMFSYRFAYQQGGRFIWTHRFILLWMPTILALALFMSIPLWNAGMSQFPGVLAVDRALQHAGIFLNASLYHGFGQFLLACLLVVQGVSIGWHYTMQALGVALACAHSDGYPVTAEHRKILRWHMLALWLMNAFSGFTYFKLVTNRSFEYYTPRFPDPLKELTCVAVVLTAVLVWSKIVWPNYKEHRRWPPINSITTVIAAWLWMQPFWYPFGFQLWVVPFGHSLQYLAFVYRVEKHNAGALQVGKPQPASAKNSAGPLRYLPMLLVIFFAGFLSFQAIPEYLDSIRAFPFLTASFFVIAAEIFINVHHYWIDSVVWRSADSKVRSLLVKPAA